MSYFWLANSWIIVYWKMALKYLIILLVLVVGSLILSKNKAELPQNHPVDTNNDFISLSAPPEMVANLLRKYCYNCHSFETQYPKSAQYAPFHKKYIEPVQKGREKLNFSDWPAYPEEIQKMLLLLSVEELVNHTMPVLGVFGTDTLTQKNHLLLTQWLAQEGEAGM